MSSYYDDPHQNPYWQNLTGNGDDSQQDDMNRQNTRSTDPNWHPEQEYGRQLARTAGMFGFMSILTCFFLPVFVPAMLGGTAVILAILSRGREQHLGKSAKHAVILGTIGIVINISVFAVVGVTLYGMIHNPSMRQQANQVTEQMYGRSFDEMLQQMENSLGIDLETGDVLQDENDTYNPDSNASGSNPSEEIIPNDNNNSDSAPADQEVFA